MLLAKENEQSTDAGSDNNTHIDSDSDGYPDFGDASCFHNEHDSGAQDRQQNKEFIRRNFGVRMKFKLPEDHPTDHAGALSASIGDATTLGDTSAPTQVDRSVMKLLVAQDIPRKERMRIEEAKKAVDKEWKRLRDKKTWQEPRSLKEVVFLADVIKKSKSTGVKIHIGRLFDICVLKGSELPEGHQNRKRKGRVVFGGNNVRDEFGLAAMFPEQGSGASYAAASKFLDAVACLKGSVGQQSDAPAAYTQSDMYEQDAEGHEVDCFVEIPEWQWNDHMKQAYAQTGKRPACKLLKSLY